ncbi:MAG: hypothetical protein ACOCXA_07985 [Planctomycetota bacterium]
MQRTILSFLLLGLVCAQAEAVVEVVSQESALNLVQRIRAVSPGDDVVAIDEVDVTLRNGTTVTVSAIWDGKNLVLRPKSGGEVNLPEGVEMFERCSIAVIIDEDEDDIAIGSILGWTAGGASVTELTFTGGTITERVEDDGVQITDTYDGNADRNASDMLSQIEDAAGPAVTDEPDADTDDTTDLATLTPQVTEPALSPQQEPAQGGGGGGALGGGGFGGGFGGGTDPATLIGGTPIETPGAAPVEDGPEVSPTNP